VTILISDGMEHRSRASWTGQKGINRISWIFGMRSSPTRMETRRLYYLCAAGRAAGEYTSSWGPAAGQWLKR